MIWNLYQLTSWQVVNLLLMTFLLLYLEIRQADKTTEWRQRIVFQIHTDTSHSQQIHYKLLFQITYNTVQHTIRHTNSTFVSLVNLQSLQLAMLFILTIIGLGCRPPSGQSLPLCKWNKQDFYNRDTQYLILNRQHHTIYTAGMTENTE